MATVARRVFDTHDKDKSGKLNRWEFGQVCADLGYRLSAAELDLAVKVIDTDGGGISWPEFQKFWRSDNRFQHLQKTDAELAQLQQAQAFFNYYDKDHSGTISHDEYKAMHASLVAHHYPVPADAAVVLRVLDNDGNGQVSFNEYVQWLAGLHAAHGK